MPKQRPGRSEQSVATPHDFLSRVKTALGIETFVWDFAASRVNTVSPRGYFDEADDALTIPDWHTKTGAKGWGWLNPPYANIAPWVERCADCGDLAHIALLVPASVGSNWFREEVLGQALVIALNGRLTFCGHTAPYPKDLMLCLYGPDVIPRFTVWDWRHDSSPI